VTMSHRVIDLTTHPDDRDAHLLRLSLDLQLDAMLLTLGAAAAQQAATDTPARKGPDVDVGIPWQRWLAEDLELTRALTATAISVDAALPPTLGGVRTHEQPAVVAEDLLARYESLCALLTDLVGGEEEEPGSIWQSSVHRALVRCRARVDELRRERETVRVPLHVPSREEHRYLPGELLG
jgi:hypothetical protein